MADDFQSTYSEDIDDVVDLDDYDIDGDVDEDVDVESQQGDEEDVDGEGLEAGLEDSSDGDSNSDDSADEGDEGDEGDDITEFNKMLNLKRKNEHRTHPVLSKYEMTALVGYRAQMIARGAKPYVEITDADLTDPVSIAIKELKLGKLPLMVERPLPSRSIGKFTHEPRTLDELYMVHSIL